ncbi:MAG: chemotaxis protein CheB [Hyphomicrobiales bacterium]|nr:chemotaxis protein CheB [Hyphomicrobiales bacterium]
MYDHSPRNRSPGYPTAIVIAASTGGPQAVLTICSGIASSVASVPVFLVQHMPDGFADIIASQIHRATGLPATASRDGMTVKGGQVYVANSGSHLKLKRHGLAVRLQQEHCEPVNYCKPAADVLFASAAEVFRDGVVGVVLSGMGIDGLNGCRAIASVGGRLLAQDEDSSAVWGMPGAVARSGLKCDLLPPDRIAGKLRLLLCKRELASA